MNQPENTARCQQDMSQTPASQNQMNKAFHSLTNISLNTLWVWPRYQHESKRQREKLEPFYSTAQDNTGYTYENSNHSTRKIHSKNWRTSTWSEKSSTELLGSSRTRQRLKQTKNTRGKMRTARALPLKSAHGKRKIIAETTLTRKNENETGPGPVGGERRRAKTNTEAWQALNKIELGNSDLLGKQPYRDRAEKTKELKLEQKASRHTCTRVATRRTESRLWLCACYGLMTRPNLCRREQESKSGTPGWGQSMNLGRTERDWASRITDGPDRGSTSWSRIEATGVPARWTEDFTQAGTKSGHADPSKRIPNLAVQKWKARRKIETWAGRQAETAKTRRAVSCRETKTRIGIRSLTGSSKLERTSPGREPSGTNSESGAQEVSGNTVALCRTLDWKTNQRWDQEGKARAPWTGSAPVDLTKGTIQHRLHRTVQQKHRRPAVVRLLARNEDRTSSAAKDRVETGTFNNAKHKRTNRSTRQVRREI
jgi:hypothetical protein